MGRETPSLSYFRKKERTENLWVVKIPVPDQPAATFPTDCKNLSLCCGPTRTLKPRSKIPPKPSFIRDKFPFVKWRRSGYSTSLPLSSRNPYAPGIIPERRSAVFAKPKSWPARTSQYFSGAELNWRHVRKFLQDSAAGSTL